MPNKAQLLPEMLFFDRVRLLQGFNWKLIKSPTIFDSVGMKAFAIL